MCAPSQASRWRRATTARLGLMIFCVSLAAGCSDDAIPGGPTDSATAVDGSDNDGFSRQPCETAADCTATLLPCQYASCVPGVGCVTLALPDGAVCKHDDACTLGGICQGALCEGATAKNCDDGDPCTADSCAESACVHTPVPLATGATATACDDGNPCTAGDTCVGATCTGGTNTCACEQDTDCAAVGGGDKCAGKFYCDKSEAPWSCTQNPATVVVCVSAKNTTCLHNTCDPKTGGCKMQPANEGKACDDGALCTIGDVCKGGSCEPGKGVCCKADADCLKADDGDLCNGVWFCNQVVGQCFLNPATVVSCPSVGDTECQTTLCTPKTGLCAKADVKDGKLCDDGNPCTPDSLCNKGACEGGTNVCPCASDSDCADKDDGDLCNGVSFCDLSVKKCKPDPTTVVTCASVNDTGCSKNQCAPKTGKCSPKPVANGTSCYDDNPCTAGDVCEGGTCTPGKDACICTSDKDCAPWEDGDKCNGSLFCDLGTKTCKIAPATVVGCPSVDNTECQKSLCQPKLGKCVLTYAASGTKCDDGVPCTVGDVCTTGKCKPGADICKCKTDATCAGQDDGDLCNGVPYCDKTKLPWLCKTNPKTVVTCPSVDDTFCQKNLCQAKTGKCVETVLHVDEACDDGLVCTQGTVCKAGKCLNPALDPKQPCDDKNICTTDSCDPKLGCVFTANTLPCDDGDKCTDKDVCSKKACNAGKPVDCGDGNACTTEICNAVVGCIIFDNASSCSDGDACTLLDVCKAGSCASGVAKVCNDGKLCTKDVCDAKTGACTIDPKVTGKALCDDGIGCTSDSCSASAGCTHIPSSALCSDGVACTVDSCFVGLGCTFTPQTKACDDDKDCTIDTCVANKGCVHNPTKDGAGCSDGAPCTIGDVCKSGACKAGPVAPGCLIDKKQCKGKADGAACNDGDACTKGEACLQGACRAEVKAFVVSNVIGNGSKYHYDEDGVGVRAKLRDGRAIALAPNGAVYFSTVHADVIRRLDADGSAHLVAGTLHEGQGFRDGPALQARFYEPWGLAVDKKGVIFVADTYNNRVRRIGTDAMVTTFAGSGAASVKDGKGGAAQLHNPTGLAFDDKGQLYVCESGSSTIRRIATDGTVVTVAGGVKGYLDGKGKTARLRRPLGIAWSPLGMLLVADNENHAIRQVWPDGTVKTLARHAKGYSGTTDGKDGTERLYYPNAITVDPFGVAYFGEPSRQVLRRVMPNGAVTTVVGKVTTPGNVNGVGAAARLYYTQGMTIHPAGYLLLMEAYRIRRVDLRRHACDDGKLCTPDTCDPATGKCGVAAPLCDALNGACLTSTCDAKTGKCLLKNKADGGACDDGDVCTTAHTCYSGGCVAPATVSMFAGKPGGSTKYDAGRSDGPPASARFNRPSFLARLSNGDVLMTDHYNHLIRRLSPDGWVTTVAGNPGGEGKSDGQGTAASFTRPLGIAVAPDDSAWICDYLNHRIRRMDASGKVTTIAGNNAGSTDGVGVNATFKYPYGIDLDAAGEAIVTDLGNHRLRRVRLDGKVTTWAGATAGWVDGPIASARFHGPTGVNVGPKANVWIADAYNNAIRRISPDGTVITVAGRRSGDADSTSSHTANFKYPTHAVMDTDGVLYIADLDNHRVRARYPDGRVTTIAGHAVGVSDGIGKAAGMNGPFGLLLYDGDLLVTDHRAHEVRRIKLAKKTCTDGKVCTADHCDGALGCLFAPMADGAGCDDGKPCTAPGACKSGLCASGKAVAGCVCKAGPGAGCDDANPCTVDDCDPAKGCSHVARSEGRGCDDGSPCTTGERCDGGSCRTDSGAWSSWRWAGSTGTQYGDGWRLKTVAHQAVGGFERICGSDLDATNTLWIADCYRHSIRKMTPDGTITTVAGPGGWSEVGHVDAPGTAARFNGPWDVSVALDGSVVVADHHNHRIRRVDTKANVTTVAGQKTAGFLDGKGAAARFNYPAGLTVDPVGSIYVADQNNRRIRRIAPDGQVTTLAGNGISTVRDGSGQQASFGTPYEVDRAPQGHLIVVDLHGPSIRRVTTTGEVHTLLYNAPVGSGPGFGVFSATISAPRRVDSHKDGSIFFVDEGFRKVQRISPGGMVTSLAGNGVNASVDGLGNKAGLHSPRAVHVRGDGKLYVPSYNGHWIHLVEHGECDDHNRCTLDVCDAKKGCTHTPQPAKKVCADRGPCAPATCDPKVGRCTWKALPNGTVCGGAACNQICSHGSCVAGGVLSRWLGDGVGTFKGGPRATARVSAVYGMAEDKSGVVYIADYGRHIIVKVDTQDQVSIVAGKSGTYGYQEGTGQAAKFNAPRGLIVTSDGGLVVADRNNHRLRKITKAGVVSTLAGSTKGFKDAVSTLAKFNSPMGLSHRADGMIAVADTSNNRVRLVDTKGKVSTLAGSTWGMRDGPVATALIGNPVRVSWGDNNDLFTLQQGYARLRRVRAGMVTTIAGWAGNTGYGEGHLVSGLYDALDMARLPNGSFVVASYRGHQLRMVHPNGAIQPFVGSTVGVEDGLGPDAHLSYPTSLLRRANGELLVGTSGGRVLRVRTDLTTCAALRGISAAQPASSCQQIQKTKAYNDITEVWLDADGPGGEDPWKTSCDLTSDGGGWSQVTAETPAAQVNKLLGGKGQVMLKCSPDGEAYVISPVTTTAWSWSAKTAVTGDWHVRKTGNAKTIVACGADPSFKKHPCGWGFGCAAGSKTTDAYVLPGLANTNQCADTKTAFTGGPMSICTKLVGGTSMPNSQHKSWVVYVRKAP